MGLFDNYGSDETVNETINDNGTEQAINENHANGLFDTFASDSNEQETSTGNDIESTENVDDDENNSTEAPKLENEHVSNEQSSDSASKPLSYKDLDDYFAKQKNYEQAQAELARYKEAEAAQLAAKKAEEDKANEMPDPVYHPEEYRKWTYEQNKRVEDAYAARLAQVQNEMVVQNLTRSLDSTYNASVETYGKDTVSNAEKWAANIIKEFPKEAMDILNKNPSWDFIVKEFQKSEMEAKFKADPEAYINAQIEARLAQQTQAQTNTIQDTKAKRRTPSISSINTTQDPQKSVPSYLQGLF